MYSAQPTRTLTGLACVYGLRTGYNSVFLPGCFTEYLKWKEPVLRYEHKEMLGATGEITSIREVTRSSLPAQVLRAHPNALGGLLVTRQYGYGYFGEKTYNDLMRGVPLQMSVGLPELQPGDAYKDGKDGVEYIRHARLVEISDVTQGYCPGTVAYLPEYDHGYIPGTEIYNRVEALTR